MSNRRKIKPADVARQDQALARARDYNRQDAKALTIFVAAISDGTQCCWCDCPDPAADPSSPHRQPGYQCAAPCAEPATMSARVLGKGGEGDEDYPLCDRHQPEFAAIWQNIGPSEVRTY